MKKRGAQNAAYLQKPNIEELKINDASVRTGADDHDCTRKMNNNAFIREAEVDLHGVLGTSVGRIMNRQRRHLRRGATHVTQCLMA